MINERILRRYPQLVKMLTGLEAEMFWALAQKAEVALEAQEKLLRERPGRKHAPGAGRPYEHPMCIRVAVVMSYMRLHVSQDLVAALLGVTQTDVWRELRRLQPLLREILPVPEVWAVEEEQEGNTGGGGGVAGDEKPAAVAVGERLGAEALADGRALVDATEQEVERSQDSEERKKHYSGKQKTFTLKTQLVTDGERHIVAISEAVPGTMHDKKLSDETQTVERLPNGCEADADKGYQGMATGVPVVTVRNVETGEEQQVPRVTVKTPFKKPPKGELTEEQKEFNRALAQIRVRVEHCIGWVKNWWIFATRYRCAHSIYTPLMQVVCGIVNWVTSEREKLAGRPLAATACSAP